MTKVQNIRLGFANNSSSSHSIVFLKGGAEDALSDTEFGWDPFVVASKRNKENYLISTIASDLADRLGTSTAKLILAQLLDRKPNDIHLEGYVDHQSQILIPREFKGQGLDVEFFNELKDAMLQDGVIVLGGNDNESDGHVWFPEVEKIPISKIPKDYFGDWVARKDGDMWVLFCRKNGTKLRFSFKGDIAYNKSSLPELVDVKLTDYCPYGCFFCYQGSTVAGRHANLYSVRNLARALGEHRVFEVALGGGETTLHPDFIEILATFREEGIVPNFTTRNIQWLKGEHREKILSLCGSFAYSTEKVSEISNLNKALEYYNVDKSRVSLQFVAGVTSPYELRRLCEQALLCNLNFTILGYKSTGRGEEFQPKAQPLEYWKAIKELSETNTWMRVGIDTVFAEQIKSQLEEDGVDSMFYHTRDGVFSCYIDAVASTMAPSSYCDKSEHRPLDINTYGIDITADFSNIYQIFS